MHFLEKKAQLLFLLKKQKSTVQSICFETHQYLNNMHILEKNKLPCYFCLIKNLHRLDYQINT